jgi:hypothetical protein
MASNRFNAEKRAAAQHAPTETPKQALTAFVRHGARVQIAAFAAAG